ncbi:saposin-related [Anaeramoeba flamelloides]|uniref:Saposin-related n=1 Tax=Anaeramoeba flamelloides TaxID=1746091 RepID=A0AAV7YG85_9EUKA|nr:saposin-related [Anaeramoeba flamelloides]
MKLQICVLISLAFFAFAFAEQSVGFDKCETCDYLVGSIEKWLVETKTEEEIDSLLDLLCKFLPEKERNFCDDEIKANLPVILEFLEQEQPAHKVCQEIRICTTLKEAPKDIECPLCEFLMKNIEAYLEDAKTEEEIEKELNKLCKLLPSSYSGMCKTMVAEYLPVIIDKIEDNVPPQKICALIGLCSNSEELEGGIVCLACSEIMKFVEDWLAEGKTIAEIEKLLENVCSLVPKTYQSICDGLIESYIPEIIKYLEQEAPPSTICGLVGLC